jgi:hypothetical protein
VFSVAKSRRSGVPLFKKPQGKKKMGRFRSAPGCAAGALYRSGMTGKETETAG